MSREDRVNQLVAVCVHNNKTPTNTASFADFIMRVSGQSFGASRQTAKEYARTLVNIFRMDKWRSNVKGNTYLKEEERRQWLSDHS